MHATIDQTLERVEQLYAVVTGTRPPHLDRHIAAIPPESDPVVHVAEQLARMIATAERLATQPPPWIPRALIWREENVVVIALDIPGITREGLTLRAEAGVLSVSGERKAPWGTVGSLGPCDAPLGGFRRDFPLGNPVDATQVTAHLADGVLTIRINQTNTPARGTTSQIPIRS